MLLVGLVLFALGILVSVSLHEAGHMATAKSFGMKVSRYFVGFGPTLWSFRRGETEYGIKGIPLGGFCNIVGMTPQDEDVAPEDQPRAMWRFPVWKRTIVMSAGSITHFLLGFAVLWVLFAFFTLPDQAKLNGTPPVVENISQCAQVKWDVDPQTGSLRECTPGKDPKSPAAQIGLQPGDTITMIAGQQVTGWSRANDLIRGSGGKQVDITYERDGSPIERSVALPQVERPRQDLDPTKTPTKDDLEQVGYLGVTPVYPTTKAGPIGAFGKSVDATGTLFHQTLAGLKQIPQRVPALWHALTGAPRDPNTPMSVVGATRVGGELAQHGLWDSFLLMLAALNFFIGVFNLLPLLPLDGGHIAIAWFERARTWLYARIGRADPGRVDYFKLMPITYAFILIGGGFMVLTVAADIVNPITLFGK